MTALPLWLATKVRDHSGPARCFDPLRVGDIRVARGAIDGRTAIRLVAVVDLRHQPFIEVALVSNDVDLAGSHDARFKATEAEAGFDFVVELDLAGPVYVSQLSAYRLASLPHSAEELAQAVLLGEYADGIAHRLGHATRGPDDPRRDWKHSEAAVLDQLTASARAVLEGVRPMGGVAVDDALFARQAPEHLLAQQQCHAWLSEISEPVFVTATALRAAADLPADQLIALQPLLGDASRTRVVVSDISRTQATGWIAYSSALQGGDYRFLTHHALVGAVDPAALPTITPRRGIHVEVMDCLEPSYG